MTGKVFAPILSAEQAAERLAPEVPTLRTTMPKVGMVVDMFSGMTPSGPCVVVQANDANDARHGYALPITKATMDRLPGSDPEEKVANAIAHLDRCVKGVFN